MKKIIDISIALHNKTITWPGDLSVDIKKIKSISEGDVCNLSSILLGSHSGTHLDFPKHFFNRGKTSDKMPLSLFVGKVFVIDLSHLNNKIDIGDLVGIKLNNIKRILFKTKNSNFWKKKSFNKDFIYLTSKAAKYLVEQGIELLGVDYLSVGSFWDYRESIATHKELLKSGVVILEGLDLSEVQAGNYELNCLPLKIDKLDGLPVRAVLIK